MSQQIGHRFTGGAQSEFPPSRVREPTRNSSGPSQILEPPAGLFAEPSVWRAEAAKALKVRGDELIASVSPGAAYPMALRSILIWLPSKIATIVDIGSGIGGASEWIRRGTDASLFAVESVHEACTAARSLFPRLHVIRGTAERIPLPSGSAEVVTAFGLLSLFEDLNRVLAEVARVLTPNGTFAAADLFSAGPRDLHSDPDTFRTASSHAHELQRWGLTVVRSGCGEATSDLGWSTAATRVDQWIDAHHACDPAYPAWKADSAHLNRHISEGNVVGGWLVARRCPYQS